MTNVIDRAIPEDIIERAAELHASLNVLSYKAFVPAEGADLIERALLAERLAERDRCAKVAEDMAPSEGGAYDSFNMAGEMAQEIAAAIRKGDTP